MPKCTPSSQTVSVSSSSTYPTTSDSDTSSALTSSSCTGSQQNVFIFVTYDIDITTASGGFGTGTVEYSTNAGTDWTVLKVTTSSAAGTESTANLGEVDIADIQVRTKSSTNTVAPSSSATTQSDIDSWFIKYGPRRTIVVD